MLLPNLDWNSSKSIALQLQEHLREHLESRALRVGERLPSTRHLAGLLGIHRSTVALAYQELWAQGWIDQRPGSAPQVRARLAPAIEAPSPRRETYDWNRLVSGGWPPPWRRSMVRGILQKGDRMNIKIRTARIEDSISISDLLRSLDLFQHIQAESPMDTRKRVEEQLRRCLSDESHTILLAHDEAGVMVGYLSIHWLPYMILKAPEGYVSELFVHPASRNGGIGKLLLDAAARESESRGCSRMSLLNFRDRESYERQFYSKNGWIERTDAANFIFPLPVGSGLSRHG